MSEEIIWTAFPGVVYLDMAESSDHELTKVVRKYGQNNTSKIEDRETLSGENPTGTDKENPKR